MTPFFRISVQVMCLLIMALLQLNAQNTIIGTFPPLAGQDVRLEGFLGFDTYVIDETAVNARGEFTLSWSEVDEGMGLLMTGEDRPFIVVLSDDTLRIKGEILADAQSIEILEGEENLLFERYATEHPRREQALSAWVYLERIYTLDSLFAVHDEPRNAINNEKQRIHDQDNSFLANIPHDRYVHWYLPKRKLVSSVSTIAQYRTGEIPDAMAAFRRLDYTDPRLYKSGLLRDAIDSHVWLIENSGRPLDSVFIELNISIDHIINNLAQDEQRLSEITGYLFELLEQRSLFGSSEYLAIRLLTESTCTLDANLANQMEQYRKMKKGNIAPDFSFPQHARIPSHVQARSLKEIPSEYKVVIFAAGWCAHCRQEVPAIASVYDKWKQHGVEVILVSLDETVEEFESFTGGFPFISISDFRKWDSPIALDYHIFATPTIYLLNKDLEILLRPHSAGQMDAWVDWFLVQGNR
ncbi:MAG: TlpA family protein disulfide reductase [Bacteroidota bacterium]